MTVGVVAEEYTPRRKNLAKRANAGPVCGRRAGTRAPDGVRGLTRSTPFKSNSSVTRGSGWKEPVTPPEATH